MLRPLHGLRKLKKQRYKLPAKPWFSKIKVRKIKNFLNLSGEKKEPYTMIFKRKRSKCRTAFFYEFLSGLGVTGPRVFRKLRTCHYFANTKESLAVPYRMPEPGT